MTRIDGWAEISDYAAVGDGRTLALVARDAAVDWLCLPDLDSPATFAALLDRGRGGSFRIAPEEPWRSERRYLPGTNVLETTFRTESARVRVVDALALPARGFAPHRELLRRVECVSGEARLRWSADPRPGWGAGRVRRRADGPWLVADAGGRAVALRAFGGEASGWTARSLAAASRSRVASRRCWL